MKNFYLDHVESQPVKVYLLSEDEVSKLSSTTFNMKLLSTDEAIQTYNENKIMFSWVAEDAVNSIITEKKTA